MNRPSFPIIAAALAIPLLAAGCFSTRTDSAVADQLDSLGMSLAGIRQMNVTSAYRTGLTIEHAADSIIALSADPRIRANAYTWKIYSIPVIRQIYSQNDPVAASYDALAFAMQCEEYFDTGIGSDRFGEHQLIAIQANVRIQDGLIDVMRTYLTQANFDTVVSRIAVWARRHPLTNHVFGRASTTEALDSLLVLRDQSIGSAVGRIADNVDDLSARIALLSGQLPRESRWQAEYVLADLKIQQRLDALDTTIAALTGSLQRIERTLTAGQVAVDITGLRTLHADIQGALELVQAERVIILADIERHRQETIARMEFIVEHTVAEASERAEGIINRLLWKVGVLLALVLLGVALLIVLARAIRRGQRRAV